MKVREAWTTYNLLEAVFSMVINNKNKEESYNPYKPKIKNEFSSNLITPKLSVKILFGRLVFSLYSLPFFLYGFVDLYVLLAI